MKSDTKNKTTMFWEGNRNSVHFFNNTPTLPDAASLLLNPRTSAIAIFSFSNFNNRLDITLAAHNKKDSLKYRSEMVKQILPTIEKMLKEDTTNSNRERDGKER